MPASYAAREAATCPDVRGVGESARRRGSVSSLPELDGDSDEDGEELER